MRDGIIEDDGGKPCRDLPGCQSAADPGRGDGDLDIVDAVELDTGRRLVEMPETADD